mgnify:FL=1
MKKIRAALTKQDLIHSYEKKLKAMIVMDDYDGGQAEMLRIVIDDLKGTVQNDREKPLDY